MSLRRVEELPAERGIDVSYETARCWANKFGPTSAVARRLRVASGRDGRSDRGQTDVHVAGCGQGGRGPGRSCAEASEQGICLKLLRKPRKNQGYMPDEIVTDGLASYKAAMKVLGCKHRHKPGRLLAWPENTAYCRSGIE
jgi:putative transposase